MNILVTGSAGFIGFHLAEKLAAQGHTVTGLDNINDYYDVNLKYARLLRSGINPGEIREGKKIRSVKIPGYSFVKLDLNNRELVFRLFAEGQFDRVCNLAAQAGVRYSLENPYAYIESNISGFLNILEAAKAGPVRHLVFASSSSVYGLNQKTPFSTADPADHPVSLYAATKRSNELMAHAYSHLFGIPVTGLRFFTVYGPWGRPDMAYFKFAQAIAENRPIELYNNGNMLRDFTYIDDIIEGTIAAIQRVPVPSRSSAPFVIYNLGNNRAEKLLDFVEALETAMGKKAEKILLGMQAGDVPATLADIDDVRRELRWEPKTQIADGLRRFTEWFFEYLRREGTTP
jgi:UDP-glucuronate 4-epimerase